MKNRLVAEHRSRLAWLWLFLVALAPIELSACDINAVPKRDEAVKAA